MSFTISDMQYKYPKSNDWDNKRLIGHPDRDLLSRTERYEVHDFICSFLNYLSADLTVENGQHIEKIIHEDLPEHIESRLKAREWIHDYLLKATR